LIRQVALVAVPVGGEPLHPPPRVLLSTRENPGGRDERDLALREEDEPLRRQSLPRRHEGCNLPGRDGAAERDSVCRHTPGQLTAFTPHGLDQERTTVPNTRLAPVRQRVEFCLYWWPVPYRPQEGSQGALNAIIRGSKSTASLTKG